MRAQAEAYFRFQTPDRLEGVDQVVPGRFLEARLHEVYCAKKTKTASFFFSFNSIGRELGCGRVVSLNWMLRARNWKITGH